MVPQRNEILHKIRVYIKTTLFLTDFGLIFGDFIHCLSSSSTRPSSAHSNGSSSRENASYCSYTLITVPSTVVILGSRRLQIERMIPMASLKMCL